MPSVWEWKYWCVDDMTQGGIGEVWAEVFKRHPKDKKKPHRNNQYGWAQNSKHVKKRSQRYAKTTTPSNG